MNQEQLMHRVQTLSFVIVDVGLFLDTHPTDQKALEYFNKYNAMYQTAKEEYERRFGPLTICGTNDTQKWSWVDSPWPWQ